MAETETNIEIEEWRIIEGFEDYAVSSLGNVRRATESAPRGLGTRLRAGRPVLPAMVRRGYLQVGLRRNGTRHHIYVARLVAHAFIGPRPDGMTVNHIDGIKTNNRVRNLEYATPREQIRHAFATGLRVRQRGEDCNAAKLTYAQAREILALRQSGALLREIAAQFSISETTVSSIARGLTWTSLK